MSDPFLDLIKLSPLKVPATIPAHYWHWAWVLRRASKGLQIPRVDLKSIVVRSKPIQL